MEAIKWTFSVPLLICLSSIQVRPIIYAYGAFIEHHLSSFHNDVSFDKLPGCVMSKDNVTLNVSCSHFKIRQYSKRIPPETYSLNITGGNLIRLVQYVVQSTSVLRRLVRLDLSNNQRLACIYLQDFSSVQNSTLRELELRNCSLKTIENGAFVPLANLQILDLRQNSLPYVAVKNATTGLNNNNLKTLKF
ncbi:uncharacterized protein LOC143256280 [Tachypleus tridentatus]|uniref:uncharacterized protein LOC143256280 n=1 Tax=Tachypleus tridentatus TaxID=6853 RepID=UPI003FD39EFF